MRFGLSFFLKTNPCYSLGWHIVVIGLSSSHSPYLLKPMIIRAYKHLFYFDTMIFESGNLG